MTGIQRHILLVK